MECRRQNFFLLLGQMWLQGCPVLYLEFFPLMRRVMGSVGMNFSEVQNCSALDKLLIRVTLPHSARTTSLALLFTLLLVCTLPNMSALCLSSVTAPLCVLQLYSTSHFHQPLDQLLLCSPLPASPAHTVLSGGSSLCPAPLGPDMCCMQAPPSPPVWSCSIALPTNTVPLSQGRDLSIPFGLALCFLSLGHPPPLLRSANHSFPCQPANWFILPPSQLSLPCRNEAISPRWRLPVAAASTQIMRAGIINEDKVLAAWAISPTAPLAAASFIIRLSCRRKLLNPDPCIRALY